MIESEIDVLSAEAYNLTDIGREALSAVAEKGFKIKWRRRLPEEPKGVPIGDCEDELNLETLCQVKSEADARRTKGFLMQTISPGAWGLITSPTLRISEAVLPAELTLKFSTRTRAAQGVRSTNTRLI